jgi:polyphosphate kinase 2
MGKKKEKSSTSHRSDGRIALKDLPKSTVPRLQKKYYEAELERVYQELVKLQYWIQEHGERLLITFDGRDAAGKGGIIKRIMDPLNPRGVRLVALGKPTEREQTQWYFQRYAEHLPAAGEIVIFDRSWYNRATVEHIMGFCTDKQYWEFLRSAPEFERMITRSGITLLKYWLSVSDDEQELRFQSRAVDPTRRWKLSPIDLESRQLWVEYSKAKDIMLEYTDIPEARWYQVDGDDKRRARLNVMQHILASMPYEDIIPKPIKLSPRPPDDEDYVRPPLDKHIYITDHYADKVKDKNKK